MPRRSLRFMKPANMIRILLLLGALCWGTEAYWGNYHCTGGNNTIVHLFEWKWTDIENQCGWLANAGYCAVQVKECLYYL